MNAETLLETLAASGTACLNNGLFLKEMANGSVRAAPLMDEGAAPEERFGCQNLARAINPDADITVIYGNLPDASNGAKLGFDITLNNGPGNG